MDFDRIKQLLDKYYEGLSSAKEENELYDYFSGPEIDKRLEEFKIDFLFSISEKQVRPSIDFKPKLAMHFEDKEKDVFQIPKRWIQYAAAVVLVMLSFSGGFFSGKSVEANKVPSTELANLENEINQLKSMYALSLLGQNRAHKRMEAISMVKNFNTMEDMLLLEVVKVLRYDENENVRLVALETLKGFMNDERVYNAVLNSIPFQSSDIVVQDMLAIPQLVEFEDARSKWRDYLKDRNLDNPNLRNSIDSQY